MDVGQVVGVVVGGVLLALLLVSLFNRRYREGARPQSGWTATEEVFLDPSTSRTMRVWLDRSGARHYVVDERPPSS